MEDRPNDAREDKYVLPTIGGIFGRTDHERFLNIADPGLFDAIFPTTVRGQERVLFETGIDALASFLVPRANQLGSIKLWTAENFCRESLSRLEIKLDDRIEFASYKSPQDLSGVSKDDVVLYLHFNRYDPESIAIIKSIQRNVGTTVVEDFVHAPLDIARFTGEFAFNSLRKFSSLEVSVAYLNAGPHASQDETQYRSLRKQAELVRSEFLDHPSENLEQQFLRLGRDSEAALAVREISLAHPNEITRAIAFDFRTVQELRRLNHSSLAEQLNGRLPGILILPGDYMYLILKTAHRDQLRAELFTKRIFPVIHWADSNCEQSRSLLSLHIDQRYSNADMDRVASEVVDIQNRFSNLAPLPTL